MTELHASDEPVQLRDRLRARFSALDIDVRVVTTEGTRRSIVIGHLPLTEARRLVDALDALPLWPRHGARR